VRTTTYLYYLMFLIQIPFTEMILLSDDLILYNLKIN